MVKRLAFIIIAIRLWVLTALLFACAACSLYAPLSSAAMAPLVFLASFAASIPALILLTIGVPVIQRCVAQPKQKLYYLLTLQLLITLGYSLLISLTGIFSHGSSLQSLLTTWAVLSGCSLAALVLNRTFIANYFSVAQHAQGVHVRSLLPHAQSTFKKQIIMQTFEPGILPGPAPAPQSNKLLVKGTITGVLILLMLIPTIFINNIISEREQRQKEVVKEVSSKWAGQQTIAGPYLVVPYSETTPDSDGKPVTVKRPLILLAAELQVNGKLISEERPRSIYKVLLYKTALSISGNFKPVWPTDINTSQLDLSNARLCFNISDFKGIEEELKVNFNKQELLFNAGLPVSDFGQSGLSAPVSLTAEALNAGMLFDMHVQLKGSEQLHFLPLAANSTFAVSSQWPGPSFDGNTLPNERQVSDKGFSAKWTFNRANLPFGTVLKPGVISPGNMAFGVSMVQPADQYDKTMRCVKYAILFIGLTFALFFIIEIMQHKPFHPVQYVLVGLALVIFYALLLSISEFMLFDYAYLIASLATILLISAYARSHFKSFATAGIFFTTLSLLYGFIFILIRLEDTALLVGSIGLFVVLALVMYASRRINWYGEQHIPAA